MKTKIALRVKTEKLEKYVMLLDNNQVGLVDKYEESKLFESEQEAFTIRKDIIKKLGPKTKVEFVLC